MKKFLALGLILCLVGSLIDIPTYSDSISEPSKEPYVNTAFQDPVGAKKDNIYVEFITDCNWKITGLTGQIKLHPQHNNSVTFRAWQPGAAYGTFTVKGLMFWAPVEDGVKDFMLFPWSSVKAEFGTPVGVDTVPWKWHYVIHHNLMALNGLGVPNAETHMRVWGPCDEIMLFDGEALIKHGDKEYQVRVDEDDYAHYPPWKITLK